MRSSPHLAGHRSSRNPGALSGPEPLCVMGNCDEVRIGARSSPVGCRGCFWRPALQALGAGESRSACISGSGRLPVSSPLSGAIPAGLRPQAGQLDTSRRRRGFPEERPARRISGRCAIPGGDLRAETRAQLQAGRLVARTDSREGPGPVPGRRDDRCLPYESEKAFSRESDLSPNRHLTGPESARGGAGATRMII